MADILKVTAPLINKTQTPEAKRNVELSSQFPLQNPARVNKPAAQPELLGQNNGLSQQQEDTSALLLRLLKDPSVTVHFLKNISSMEAFIKLLPANNNPFTQEIEQLFEQLLVSPEQIAAELQRQEKSSTMFKGPLFDLLREALEQNPEQAELRQAEVGFLKALTLALTRREALGSVANSLNFLSSELSSSKTLSASLAQLASQYQQQGSVAGFAALRQQTMELMAQVQDSILFGPKTEKVVKMVIYNLSRYNDNADFLQEAMMRVLAQLHGDRAREQFTAALTDYLSKADQQQIEKSDVMQVLTRILKQQAENPELMALNGDKMQKIIHSLLSSPCNFTPLLHFVVPVRYEDLQAFAEIWVNPNGEEDDRTNGKAKGRATHFLLVFDIGGMGRFELELFCRGQEIALSLFCPPAYASLYQAQVEKLRACVGQTGYHFSEINVQRLEHPRSLMDVFRSLPYKRTGVDVTV